MSSSAVEVVDSLLQTIKTHDPICNISAEQRLPHERELALIFHQLKTRNLYRLNIDNIHSKLQTILSQIPIYTKHSLLNKYYAHSWISHVSHKLYLTPLAIFVTLLKKYVIRKKFHVLWDIIVLLLRNGANPLLVPLQIDCNNINKTKKILSLQLIWSIFLNLFIFIDDEQEILKKVSFVLSFIDECEFNTLLINDAQSIPHYFNITSCYPSICGDALDSHIPSPLFLSILLQFSFPIFDSLNNNHSLYHLSFVRYHQIFFDHKLIDFIAIYQTLEKEHKYPLLTDGICNIIIGMTYGQKMSKQWKEREDDGYYLFHLFGLNNDWIEWSFIHIWRHKTDKELKDIVHILSSNDMYLDDWSGRVRESCYYSSDFVKFYIKIIEYQARLSEKEIAMWMKKYEDNADILQLLFRQKYTVNKTFVGGALYGYFWSVLCEKETNCMVLRLLNKHLVEKSVSDGNGFEYVYLTLFNDFCDKYNGLNWKIKSNLMMNMISLVQQWKLNGLDIVNTRYGLQCIFNGASSSIFKQLTEHNLFNIKEIEINVIFDIFRKRGKYIQSRHKNIMIQIGIWLINQGKKEKLIHFVHRFAAESQQIHNEALKQKQITMIEDFKKEWSLH